MLKFSINTQAQSMSQSIRIVRKLSKAKPEHGAWAKHATKHCQNAKALLNLQAQLNI
jgi:hypothetical protein